MAWKRFLGIGPSLGDARATCDSIVGSFFGFIIHVTWQWKGRSGSRDSEWARGNAELTGEVGRGNVFSRGGKARQGKVRSNG